MPETFLILLAGGVLLAAAVPNPGDVTLHWLRLGGIIALALTALSVFFSLKDGGKPIAIVAYGPMLIAVLGQLGLVQIAWRGTQRILSLAAFAASVWGAHTVFPFRLPQNGEIGPWLTFAGIAAVTGIALMDMLLGHAYLTASRMMMKPFARLNVALAITIVLRLMCATGVVYFVNRRHPVPMLIGLHGLYIGTRLLVGLVIPLVFVIMAHDCIRRRATQSATGILYVCGVLVLIGELIALPLLRDTGLPF